MEFDVELRPQRAAKHQHSDYYPASDIFAFPRLQRKRAAEGEEKEETGAVPGAEGRCV